MGIVLLLGALAHAQLGNLSVVQFAGAPSGACTNYQVGLNTATGDYYDCVAATWLKVGPSGGTGTITGVTAGTGLTGGGSSGSVTVSLTSPVVIANGGTNSTATPGTNALMLFNGSAIIGSSTATDNGTTLGYTGTGGITAPQITVTGTSGGQLSIIQGVTNQPPASGIGLETAASVASGFQYIFPNAPAAGVLTGTIVATPPSATCAVTSGALTACSTGFAAGSATSSLGYAKAPPCAISTTGGYTTQATCTTTVSGTYPNLIPTGFTVVNPGAGYTGTVTATVPGAGPVNLRSVQAVFTWNCHLSASLGALANNCQFTTPSNGITVTGFEVYAVTAANTCTTYPVVQVQDTTASAEVGSFAITFTSGTNSYTQVSGSTAVTGGHKIAIRINTAAASCTTTPAGVDATVSYSMTQY